MHGQGNRGSEFPHGLQKPMLPPLPFQQGSLPIRPHVGHLPGQPIYNHAQQGPQAHGGMLNTSQCFAPPFPPVHGSASAPFPNLYPNATQSSQYSAHFGTQNVPHIPPPLPPADTSNDSSRFSYGSMAVPSSPPLPASSPPLPPSPPPPAPPLPSFISDVNDSDSSRKVETTSPARENTMNTNNIYIKHDAVEYDAISEGQSVIMNILPPPPRPTKEEIVSCIETLCQSIAKNGPNVEEMALIEEYGNPNFEVLTGGEPGSEAATAHEYFLWMKKKYSLEITLRKSNETCESSLRPTEIESFHADKMKDANESLSDADSDSDMEMEDDITQFEKGQEANQSFGGSRPESIMTQDEIDEKKQLTASRNVSGTGYCKLGEQGGGSFRLLREYSSDDNSSENYEQCRDDESHIDMPSPVKVSNPSSNRDTSHNFDRDVELKVQDSSPPEIHLNIEKTVLRSVVTVEKDDQPDGRKKISHHSISQEPLQKQGKSQKDDGKSASTQLKVDEFGRLIKKDDSESDSDDFRDRRRRGKRGRNRSRSRSPSPYNRRGSPSMRKGRRRRSRSWSPRRRRSRSKSPINNRRVDEKKRRENVQKAECFDFLRGRCRRGSACRYLHHEPDKSKRSTKNQNYRDVSPSANYVEAQKIKLSPQADAKPQLVEGYSTADSSPDPKPAMLSDKPLVDETNFNITSLTQSEPNPSFLGHPFSTDNVLSTQLPLPPPPPPPMQSNYQTPLPNQQAHFSIPPPNSGWNLLPPPPPPPSLPPPPLVGNVIPSFPQFQQNNFPTSNQFASQTFMRPYQADFSNHSQVTEFQNPYPSPMEHYKPPLNMVDNPPLGSFNAHTQMIPPSGLYQSAYQKQPFPQPRVSSPNQGLPGNASSSFLSDFGGSRIPTHYNPYASTFDQPLSSKFNSSIFTQENNPPLSYKYDNNAPMSLILPRSGGGDQYDPLFDSFEKRSPKPLMKFDQTEENSKKELLAKENDEYGETADAEAEVGAVENASPSPSPSTPNDMDNASEGEVEVDQVKSPKKKKKSKESKDSKSMKLFKITLADFVKEVLKPSWRQGNMSKEAFKTIVKKTVDKVSVAMKGHRIPKSHAKINQYIDSSQRKLTKLVMGYVHKYVNV